MEFSIEDEIIEVLISNLEYGKFMHLPTTKIIEVVGLENAHLFDSTFKICEDINLIDRKGKRTFGVLLLDGYNIQREGGWLKYIERKELERLKEEERQNKSDQILDLDIKLKNFEAKNGKRMIIGGFIITVLSFLVSVLTVQFYKPDENKDIQKAPIDKSKILSHKKNN